MAVERRNPPVSFQQLLQRGLAGAERANAAVQSSQPHGRPQQHVFLQILLSPAAPPLRVPPQPCACPAGPALEISSSTTRVLVRASKGNARSGSRGMTQS